MVLLTQVRVRLEKVGKVRHCKHLFVQEGGGAHAVVGFHVFMAPGIYAANLHHAGRLPRGAGRLWSNRVFHRVGDLGCHGLFALDLAVLCWVLLQVQVGWFVCISMMGVS